MAYVHFDRNEIVAAMRKTADASYAVALAEAPDAASRAYVRAQQRFTDVIAETFAICIDMKNAGDREDMVAAALGACLGGLVGTVVRNSSNPEKSLVRINHAFEAAILRSLGVIRADFSCAEPIYVGGVAGGRA